jgi:hypothetical protein
MPPKSSGRGNRTKIFCPDCNKSIDCRSEKAFWNHLNRYCTRNVNLSLERSHGPHTDNNSKLQTTVVPRLCTRKGHPISNGQPQHTARNKSSSQQLQPERHLLRTRHNNSDATHTNSKRIQPNG